MSASLVWKYPGAALSGYSTDKATGYAAPRDGGSQVPEVQQTEPRTLHDLRGSLTAPPCQGYDARTPPEDDDERNMGWPGPFGMTGGSSGFVATTPSLWAPDADLEVVGSVEQAVTRAGQDGL